MNFFGVSFLETAALGVLGAGGDGIVSRCVECRAELKPGQPCNGFGAGCVVRNRIPTLSPALSQGERE